LMLKTESIPKCMMSGMGSSAAACAEPDSGFTDVRKGKKMKLVYSYYVLDIVHKGHLLMMKNAKAIAGEDGKLIVGILTDEAVMEKKPKPILSFEDRVNLAF